MERIYHVTDSTNVELDSPEPDLIKQFYWTIYLIIFTRYIHYLRETRNGLKPLNAELFCVFSSKIVDAVPRNCGYHPLIKKTWRYNINTTGIYEQRLEIIYWNLSANILRTGTMSKSGEGILIIIHDLSQLMRLWHFSSSVNSFFKHACEAIKWG